MSTTQKPSIGRIIHYTLTEFDAEQINRRRTTSLSILRRRDSGDWPNGAQAHIGNSTQAGDEVAAIIVAVWSDTCVNAQAILDGNDSLWLASIEKEPDDKYPACGKWKWPVRS